MLAIRSTQRVFHSPRGHARSEAARLAWSRQPSRELRYRQALYPPRQRGALGDPLRIGGANGGSVAPARNDRSWRVQPPPCFSPSPRPRPLLPSGRPWTSPAIHTWRHSASLPQGGSTLPGLFPRPHWQTLLPDLLTGLKRSLGLGPGGTTDPLSPRSQTPCPRAAQLAPASAYRCSTGPVRW